MREIRGFLEPNNIEIIGKNNKSVNPITKEKSLYTTSSENLNDFTEDASPTTISVLNRFEPIIFPSAISCSFFK